MFRPPKLPDGESEGVALGRVKADRFQPTTPMVTASVAPTPNKQEGQYVGQRCRVFRDVLARAQRTQRSGSPRIDDTYAPEDGMVDSESFDQMCEHVLRRLRHRQLAPIKPIPTNSCVVDSGASLDGVRMRNSWTCPERCTGPTLVTTRKSP